MALSGATRGQNATNTAGQSTLVITPTTADLTAGQTGVLCIAYDNSGTNGADPYSGIVDSVGNTWTSRKNELIDPGNASEGICLRIFTSRILIPLTTSDTITVSFGGVTTVARAWALQAISCAAGSEAAYVTGATATATTATPTITTGTIPVGDMIFGAVAWEGNDTITADGDTTNGAWSGLQGAGVGTTTAGARISVQRKTQTTTGSAQTFNPTQANARDLCIGWVQFHETVVSTSPNAGNAAATGGVYKPLPWMLSFGSTTSAGTGAARTPAGKVSPNTATAAATGTALDATVDAEDGATATNADAGLAEATGSAYSPTGQTKPSAGGAAATGTGHAPATTAAPSAGTAAGVGSAPDPTITTAAGPATAAGTATANTPSTTVDAPAVVASATGTAADATTTTAAATDAHAQTPDGTGSANDPNVGLAPTVGTAAAVATSHDPASTVSPAASLAAASGSAEDATVTTEAITEADVELAEAAGTAYDATVISTGATLEAHAEPATGTGTAYGPTIPGGAPIEPPAAGAVRNRRPTVVKPKPKPPKVKVFAAVASADGTAHDPFVFAESFPGLEELLLLLA